MQFKPRLWLRPIAAKSVGFLLAVGLTAVGCTGVVQAPGSAEQSTDGADDSGSRPSSGPNLPAGTTAAPVAVRRLNAAEIRNSIQDAFQLGAAYKPTFQRDSVRHGFDNQYSGSNVTVRFAEDLQVAAEKAAELLTAQIDRAIPCAEGITSASEAACLNTFFDTAGRRVYRRPLTQDERTNLKLVFDVGRRDGDFAYGVGGGVEAMLQSPSFAFRTELGDSTPTNMGATTLDGFELASALSYFLWRSGPDDTLLDAAAAGKLTDAPQVEAQAKRMLADPRARHGVRDFFDQWMETEKLVAGIEKSDPAFTPALRQAMWEETGRFVENLVLTENASFAQLITDPRTSVNKELAAIYGVAAPAGDAWAPATLDATRRGGFFTQPGFLAAHSSPSGFSPISLGLFVRQKLLCQKLPPPPADTPAPTKDPALNTRQKFAAHSDRAACKGCHALLDPIGFAFERYDDLGRYREFETVSGKKVALTGKGNLEDTDIDGEFTGPVELGKKLIDSSQVAACMVSQMMKFMLGRDTTLDENRLPLDTATIDSIVTRNAGAAVPVQAAMLALVKSPAFFHRTAALGEGVQKP